MALMLLHIPMIKAAVHLCLRVIVVPRMQKMWIVWRKGRKKWLLCGLDCKKWVTFCLGCLASYPSTAPYFLIVMPFYVIFIFFFDETEYLWFMMTSVWLISKPCSLCHETAGFCSYDILCSLHVVQYNLLSNKEYMYSDKFHRKLGVFKRSCKTRLKTVNQLIKMEERFFHLMLSLLWCGAVSVTSWMFSLFAVITQKKYLLTVTAH